MSKFSDRVASGLCGIAGCDERIQKGVYCPRHRQQRLDRLALRRKKGVCAVCSSMRLDSAALCMRCWIKAKSFKATVDASLEDLVKLWESQDGRCAYSGRVLIPGVNAHLDHKVPVSKGGSGEVDNLQWVDADVNRAKRALTEDAFIRLVEEVFRHLNYGKEKVFQTASGQAV